MISYINTNKVAAIANDLSKAANDLEIEFNMLLKRLSHVPDGTREWVGGQAERYFSIIIAEKPQYTAMITQLRALSNELKNEANVAETQIKLNNS